MSYPANLPSLINLGCGQRFHPAWLNVDLVPGHPSVQACDLSRGIPFPAASFATVYHSNVLEHIRREHVDGFIRECHRVLRPGGILRIAVPDLEQICRLYLERLERAAQGDPAAAAEYDWMKLELLDQCVREHSGGGMVSYLRQNPLPAEAFVIGRIGNEGREILDHLRAAAAQPPRPARWWRFSSRRLRCRVAAWLTGLNLTALETGRFRAGGEVHQWMYDRFSLRRLLEQHGFEQIKLQTPHTSDIPGWSGYHLEVDADGTVHKPDSFVMEGRKRA